MGGEEENGTFLVELQVQALSQSPSPNSQSWVVGTRSGSIYEIDCFSEKEARVLQEYHDNQVIVSATFSSYDKDSFYTLTNTGLVERYDIATLQRTMKYNVGQSAIKIESCGRVLLVCCRQELLAYTIKVGEEMEPNEPLVDTKKLEEEGKEVEIMQFCLSKSEKLLALSLRNSIKDPTFQVGIYSLSGECLHQLGNLKHEIDYMDFSVEDKFLLFKDRYEEIGMISLEKEYKRINTIFVEMGIEWQREALRLSPNAQTIYYSYTCENKITAVSRLGNDKIIVGDQMGTLRIFDYPCPDDRLGELHLHCYAVHMNCIAEIVVHPDLHLVLTVGVEDKSLVLWRVVQP